MKVVEAGVYRGPHLYSHRPMIRIQLDLGTLEQRPTDTILGFNDALLAELPGLERHGCCYGEPGGFVRRLKDGTWLGHVVEHVALELQHLAGSPTTRGKTRGVRGRPGVYNVMYAYADERSGLLAGRLALQIVDRLLPEALKGLEDLDRILPGRTIPELAEAATREAAQPLMSASVRQGAFGPSTQALVDAARRRGIPVSRLNDQSLVQLGWGQGSGACGPALRTEPGWSRRNWRATRPRPRPCLSRSVVPSPGARW